MIHWTSLIIFFMLSLLGLWVADTFLKKSGIFLFSALAIVFANYITSAQVFAKTLPMQVVIIPTILLAMYMLYSKGEKKDCINLLCTTLVAILCVFVVKFFEFAYTDMAAGLTIYFVWSYFNQYLASAVAYVVASIIGYVMVRYWAMKKVPAILRVAIYILIVSTIDVLVYLAIAYAGYYSFVEILLTFLVCLLFVFVISLLLGSFEQFVTGNIHFKKKNKEVQSPKTKNDKEEAKPVAQNKAETKTASPKVENKPAAKAQAKPASKDTKFATKVATKPATAAKVQAKPSANSAKPKANTKPQAKTTKTNKTSTVKTTKE